ncbi:MAG: peptidoglycan DD-metalloendopeptidase family protein [Zoogloeaceae bacterium]|nr:peptidoglycan DD-metalloendopeptidase family protein [Rhodocyclaceae bacterium]MCP5234637.1 peptidoglycan DD-metalloendopeptidase family protein [Zoogloeaceae bacterium]
MKVRHLLKTTPLTCLVLSLALGACTTRVAAPVSDRAATESIPAAPREAQPGYYIVQQGDTLHKIAQQHGVSLADLTDWNTFENPDRLEVGREIRVTPPEGVVVRPISPDGPVEVAPPGDGTQAPSPAPPDVKSGPVGGVQPYSDEAWAAVRGGSAGPTPSATPEPAPVEPATPVPPPTESRRVDGISWSWPNNGKLVGGFSQSSTRKGLDIAGSTGEPVYAAATGKVVYAGTGLRGYGKLVIIKHDSNYLSAYAHNDQLMVKEGQSVSKGQQIATLGSTDSDTPKLHFEIRRQGKPVDPSRYLPAR